MMRKLFLSLLLISALPLLFCACSDEHINYSNEEIPGVLRNIQVNNIAGGAVIKYTLPKEDDLLEVKAVYSFESGKLSVTSPAESDSIVITGAPDTRKYSVELYVRDKGGNESAPVTVTIQPMRVHDPSAVIYYTFPAEASNTGIYSLSLNDKPYYVYSVPKRDAAAGATGLNAELATFGINGDVEVKIQSAITIDDVIIRPLSAGITPLIENNTISFTINKPQNLCIEVNGDINKPFFLFANAPETDVPDKDDPNVTFFEEGKIYDKGVFSVSSNHTVYIAPGAIVRGGIITDGTENVRIMGRGILSGEKGNHSDIQTDTHRMIELDRAKNCLVEGIVVVTSPNWTIPLTACDNVEVRDVKIVNDANFDDGIDIVGSKNILIDRCFIRTKDDCIAIKSGVDYFTSFNSQINVENIRIKNSTMWNGTYGNGLEIGFETRADTIKDVIFENIDIIHNQNQYQTYESAITIHDGDRAVIDNILYKNIRIEDCEYSLFDFRILKSEYSQDTERGKISNIFLEDITVTTADGSTPKSEMRGYNDTKCIKNIKIKNLRINGAKIMTKTDLNLSSSYITPPSSITFE